MPSARASQFKGGGGILRRKDGTVVDIQFSDKNPLFKDEKKPAPANGKKPFHSLYAILSIQEDGREEVTQQPLFVGDADQFEVVLDGRGLSGEGALSKSSDFYIFLDSLSHPTDGGDGFPEANFPEDPEGLVADFSPIRGARVMFDWKKNDAKTKKLGQRTVKGKNGKPDMKFDREDLVVAVYYGQSEVDAAETTKVNKPASSKQAAGKTTTKTTTKAPAAPAVDVAQTACLKVAECVAVAKDQKLTINKLSVKLLQAMSNDPADVREEVRAWALKGDNLKGISNDYAPDGKKFVYDPASQTLSLVDED
jgi:hypothetical protein